MSPLESIKTSLFGYNKSGVYNYISQINKENAERLQEQEEEANIRLKRSESEAQERIHELEARISELQSELRNLNVELGDARLKLNRHQIVLTETRDAIDQLLCQEQSMESRDDYCISMVNAG